MFNLNVRELLAAANSGVKSIDKAPTLIDAMEATLDTFKKVSGALFSNDKLEGVPSPDELNLKSFSQMSYQAASSSSGGYYQRDNGGFTGQEMSLGSTSYSSGPSITKFRGYGSSQSYFYSQESVEKKVTFNLSSSTNHGDSGINAKRPVSSRSGSCSSKSDKRDLNTLETQLMSIQTQLKIYRLNMQIYLILLNIKRLII